MRRHLIPDPLTIDYGELMILNRRQLVIPTAAIFFRQLAAMVGAGVPIREALTSVAEDNTDLSFLADHYLGDNITENERTDFFERVFEYLEKCRQPDKQISTSLYLVADEIDKYRDYKVAMAQLLFVPVMTLVFSLLLLSVLLIFVIPVWQDMFDTMPGQLPGPTQMVLTASHFFTQYAFYIAMIIILIAGLMVIKWDSLTGVFSKLPMARQLLVCQSVVRFSRYLSILLTIGMPLKEASGLAAEEVRNSAHARKLMQAVKNMTGSTRLSTCLKQTGFISGAVQRIIDAGQGSGTLAETLREVSVLYEKEADIALARTVYWSDILIKFIVGIFVGMIVLSMYMPIFKMASTIS